MPETDAGGPPEDSSDAGAGAIDAGLADGGSGGIESTCTGECRRVLLAGTFNGKSYPFERAFFGLTAPARSTAGVWELYVEAHAGGSSGCPGASSPTPDRTLVLAGLRLPLDGTPMTRAQGVSASLLDFKGDLAAVPVLKATEVKVTARALEPCLDCESRPTTERPERVFAFELEGTFPGGEVRGYAFASHCPSMDER